MRRLRTLLTISLLFLFFAIPKAHAIVDPLSVPNNKFGIHILFNSELKDAATLVDTSGGDWGYVTIPIQAGDRDLDKWQQFMNDCKKYHLIPIIRLATEGDYFNTQVWRKPNAADILDFANFLDSLTWPTKNRYVIVFNEVNRGDEWGGTVNPDDYASLLSYAVTVFKSKSQDFFVISAGLDNAAPNAGSIFMNEYTFMGAMNDSVPGIFNQVDGIASHSYPNPGFAEPPSVANASSIASYYYERDYAQRLSNKTLPVFITETGWTADRISDDERANYYNDALKGAWADPGIVAITPFLLRAGGGSFAQFSFLNTDNSPTKQYMAFKNYPKVKGQPITPIPQKVLAAENPNPTSLPVKFYVAGIQENKVHPSVALREAFSWIMKIF